MDVNFAVVAAGIPEPVIFEKVIGEKPGGGIVANPTYDIPTGTAVGLDGTALKPIKAYKLVKAVIIADDTIEIAKGSGVVAGDVIGNAKKSVACTAVDKTDATKDVVTVTLGVAIANGTKLYQSAAASAAAALPVYTPKFITGAPVYTGKGDQLIKLVVAAVVRKENINAATEMLALLPNINAV
jgi:hypothetical protein